MDGSWAVVLGALIALAGSSLVPWLRESLAARKVDARDRRQRVNAAVIGVLSANAAQAAAFATDDDPEFLRAVEQRARAAASLMLEVSAGERRALSAVLASSSAANVTPREKLRALEHVLTGWAAGDVSADGIETAYQDEFNRLSIKVLPGTPEVLPVVPPKPRT